MKFISVVVSISVAGLLSLFSASSFAGKPDPIDCPCYLSNPGIVDVMSHITCVSSWSYSNHVGLGRKILSVYEADGEDCHTTQLLEADIGDWNACWVSIGNTFVYPNGTTICQSTDSYTYDYLTEEEMRACNAAVRDARRYIAWLPDCE